MEPRLQFRPPIETPRPTNARITTTLGHLYTVQRWAHLSYKYTINPTFAQTQLSNPDYRLCLQDAVISSQRWLVSRMRHQSYAGMKSITLVYPRKWPKLAYLSILMIAGSRKTIVVTAAAQFHHYIATGTSTPSLFPAQSRQFVHLFVFWAVFVMKSVIAMYASRRPTVATFGMIVIHFLC